MHLESNLKGPRAGCGRERASKPAQNAERAERSEPGQTPRPESDPDLGPSARKRSLFQDNRARREPKRLPVVFQLAPPLTNSRPPPPHRPSGTTPARQRPSRGTRPRHGAIMVPVAEDSKSELCIRRLEPKWRTQPTPHTRTPTRRDEDKTHVTRTDGVHMIHT